MVQWKLCAETGSQRLILRPMVGYRWLFADGSEEFCDDSRVHHGGEREVFCGSLDACIAKLTEMANAMNPVTPVSRTRITRYRLQQIGEEIEADPHGYFRTDMPIGVRPGEDE